MMSINHEDYTIEELLAAVNNSLTTGSYMTGGNFAFQMLCDKLGIDPDELPEFNPKWSHRGPFS